MKKNIKIVCLLMLLLQVSTVCFAGEFMINPETFYPTYATDISKVEGLGESILGYIVNIAAVSSVVIIAFLGIKFMLGSVEQRAEYKKSFMPLIIGVFVVLCSSAMVGIFYKAFLDTEGVRCSLHMPQGTNVDLGNCPAGVICNQCKMPGHKWVEDSRDHFGCVYCGERYINDVF